MSDEKKEKKQHKFGVKFAETFDKMQSNVLVLILTCVFAFILMIFVA